MKSTLVRILTVAILATSIPAFAATDENKPEAAATTSASQQQQGCADRADAGKKQKKEKKTKEQDQREQEFDHMLMGIYG